MKKILTQILGCEEKVGGDNELGAGYIEGVYFDNRDKKSQAIGIQIFKSGGTCEVWNFFKALLDGIYLTSKLAA